MIYQDWNPGMVVTEQWQYILLTFVGGALGKRGNLNIQGGHGLGLGTWLKPELRRLCNQLQFSFLYLAVWQPIMLSSVPHLSFHKHCQATIADCSQKLLDLRVIFLCPRTL